MYQSKIIIPRVSDKYKLYIYRSINPEDINSIDKIKNLSPIAMIDETLTDTDTYEFIDSIDASMTGLTYYGPAPTIVPCIEYESTVEVVKVNNFTYMNALRLSPLPLKYNGVMLYYSVIGVDDINNTMTNISKVNSVMVESEFRKEGIRSIYTNENLDDPKVFVASVDWTQDDIVIGDYHDQATFDILGIPVVDTVPIISAEDVSLNARDLMTRKFAILSVKNPWQFNNEEFNYRKLKNFYVQNVIETNVSNYSEANYQSILPVSIEKMNIVIAKDNNFTDIIRELNVYRKDGIFYEPSYIKYGLNKVNIPLEEDIAIFNETSSQEEIKFQIALDPNTEYYVKIYIVDVYNKISDTLTTTIHS